MSRRTTSDGSPGVADLAGYEGFDERVTRWRRARRTRSTRRDGPLRHQRRRAARRPRHDARPTAEASASTSTARAARQTFGAAHMGVAGVHGADAATSSRSTTPTCRALDLDGDGTIDLLHMPPVKTYSVYTPQLARHRLVWTGARSTTARQQSPPSTSARTRRTSSVLDVNGDGLVDVVRRTGTEYRRSSRSAATRWRRPYGSATWTSATTATCRNDPVATCLPVERTPVQLQRLDDQLADMNGDGLPGHRPRAPATCATGPGAATASGARARSRLPGRDFGAEPDIAMATSSAVLGLRTAPALRLDDVNGDGLDDLVQVALQRRRHLAQRRRQSAGRSATSYRTLPHGLPSRTASASSTSTDRGRVTSSAATAAITGTWTSSAARGRGC